jgi:hypothetical protein
MTTTAEGLSAGPAEPDPAADLQEPPDGVSGPYDDSEAADAEPGGGSGGDAGPCEDDQQTPPPKENREARYRREAREAQDRVGELEARVRDLLTADALRQAGKHLAAPADLLALGGGLDAVLDEGGNVSAELVAEACRTLLAARPGLARGARPPAPPSFAQGLRGSPVKTGRSWGDVIKGGQ